MNSTLSCRHSSTRIKFPELLQVDASLQVTSYCRMPCILMRIAFMSSCLEKQIVSLRQLLYYPAIASCNGGILL